MSNFAARVKGLAGVKTPLSGFDRTGWNADQTAVSRGFLANSPDKSLNPCADASQPRRAAADAFASAGP